MMKPKLTAKAEELIAKMEAREAAKKATAPKGDETPDETPAPVVGLGPNPLDSLGKVGCSK
jgi:hypothetical protein